MYRISNQEFSIKCIWKFVSFNKNPLLRGWKLLQLKWQLKWQLKRGTETKQQRSTNDIDTYRAQCHLIFLIKFLLDDVSFLWHDFFFRHDSLFSARFFFFGTTFFFFWARLFFGHDFFLARLFFGTSFFFFFNSATFFSARLFVFGTTRTGDRWPILL